MCGAEGELTWLSFAGPSPIGAALCAVHAERLARKIADQLGVMRAGHLADAAHTRRLRDGEALEVIRTWAREAGYPVAASGGVSQRVIAAYRESVGTASSA